MSAADSHRRRRRRSPQRAQEAPGQSAPTPTPARARTSIAQRCRQLVKLIKWIIILGVLWQIKLYLDISLFGVTMKAAGWVTHMRGGPASPAVGETAASAAGSASPVATEGAAAAAAVAPKVWWKRANAIGIASNRPPAAAGDAHDAQTAAAAAEGSQLPSSSKGWFLRRSSSRPQSTSAAAPGFQAPPATPIAWRALAHLPKHKDAGKRHWQAPVYLISAFFDDRNAALQGDVHITLVLIWRKGYDPPADTKCAIQRKGKDETKFTDFKMQEGGLREQLSGSYEAISGSCRADGVVGPKTADELLLTITTGSKTPRDAKVGLGTPKSSSCSSLGLL